MRRSLLCAPASDVTPIRRQLMHRRHIRRRVIEQNPLTDFYTMHDTPLDGILVNENIGSGESYTSLLYWHRCQLQQRASLWHRCGDDCVRRCAAQARRVSLTSFVKSCFLLTRAAGDRYLHKPLGTGETGFTGSWRDPIEVVVGSW